MAKLYYTLTEENKEKLSQIYKNLTGKKLKPPEREVHLEDEQEMQKIMEEPPSYTIDSQGRK